MLLPFLMMHFIWSISQKLIFGKKIFNTSSLFVHCHIGLFIYYTNLIRTVS